jgi:predicted house-cleaning noncanonical NTP pyrophosphatase (MazG superfamily)
LTTHESNQCCVVFQEAVNEYLVRHRSVLDILSKLQESVARTNRSVAKAVTSCGCISIDATRQTITSAPSYADLKEQMASHLNGELCEQCRDVLESELGYTLFYIAALCNLFDLSLEEVMQAEKKRISALGVYNLT